MSDAIDVCGLLKYHRDHGKIIDIESLQNRLLKVCYVPATSAGRARLLFLLQPLAVLMKQIRQAVCAVKQTILLRCLWAK
jgi:hypothetical protein